jgi:hypothetical protein
VSAIERWLDEPYWECPVQVDPMPDGAFRIETRSDGDWVAVPVETRAVGFHLRLSEQIVRPSFAADLLREISDTGVNHAWVSEPSVRDMRTLDRTYGDVQWRQMYAYVAFLR